MRDVGYGYEGRDNLGAATDSFAPANTETFTYTPRESLSGAVGPYGTLAYTYDGVGNRLTASLGAATDGYVYPATSNRLSVINLATGGTRGFTYDAAGNVVAEARPGGTYAYTYNAAGRMAEFTINGVLQASYKYDAMGRQAIRTLTSPTPVTIHSVFDSDGRRIAEYNETSGALIREYVWNGWEPIAVIEGGVISFVRADHIGRPVFATNAAGVKVWSATYSPFGGVHTSTGALPSARFPGQWFQSESGLHLNWMRDYDPTTGRYLQADPLGLVDGASVYGHAAQSPMMNMDPSGQCIGPAIVVCAGYAAGALIGAAALYYVLSETVEICEEMWNDYWLFAKPNDPPKDDPTGSDRSPPHPSPGDIKSGQGIDPTDPRTWPEPPGTNPETNETVEPERRKNRERGEKLIKDRDGNLWRPHTPDPWHPDGHWDVKPPGGGWSNIDEDGNPL